MGRLGTALIVLRTLAISLAGGLLATLADLPAGILMGGAIAVTFSGLFKIRPLVPMPVRNCAFVVIGMTLGTNVSQDSLSLLPQWPFSLVVLFFTLILIVGLCALLLNRAFGYDPATSILSSFPGHLSFVLSLAETGYGNARQIAIIQSMRVLILTISVPVFARLVAHAPALPLEAREVMPLSLILPLAAAATAGSFIFRWMNIPAAFVLGSMTVSIAGKLMGLYEGILPLPLTFASYVVMGALIGSRFYGAERSDLQRAIFGGTAATLLCIAIVTGAAFLLTQLTDMPYGQLWLGIAPGALESMGALGVAMGFDAAFIAAHHTARFFFLSIGAPVVLKFLKRTSG